MGAAAEPVSAARASRAGLASIDPIPTAAADSRNVRRFARANPDVSAADCAESGPPAAGPPRGELGLMGDTPPSLATSVVHRTATIAGSSAFDYARRERVSPMAE